MRLQGNSVNEVEVALRAEMVEDHACSLCRLRDQRIAFLCLLQCMWL